jgi:hypothetical protein
MTRRIKRARLPAGGGEEAVFTEHVWKIIEQDKLAAPPNNEVRIWSSSDQMAQAGHYETGFGR